MKRLYDIFQKIWYKLPENIKYYDIEDNFSICIDWKWCEISVRDLIYTSEFMERMKNFLWEDIFHDFWIDLQDNIDDVIDYIESNIS